MNDQPLRDALRATIEGLKPQVPAWLVPGHLEGFDEDGIPFHERGDERGQLTSQKHLVWMLDHALAHVDIWPVDKTSRWVGFVQGVMAVKAPNYHVNDERDRTRPIFHAAYEAMGFDKPKTTERND